MKPAKDLYQVSLKAFLKNDKGETLILGADVGGTFNGYFDFPGGRIDDNEFDIPFETILRREIKEETGITDVKINSVPVALGRHALPGKFESSGHDVHVLYIFFEGQIQSVDVTLSPEHTSVQWVDLTTIDVAKYFISGIREGVEMYNQGSKN